MSEELFVSYQQATLTNLQMTLALTHAGILMLEMKLVKLKGQMRLLVNMQKLVLLLLKNVEYW